jgi:hypothetical protein
MFEQQIPLIQAAVSSAERASDEENRISEQATQCSCGVVLGRGTYYTGRADHSSAR